MSITNEEIVSRLRKSSSRFANLDDQLAEQAAKALDEYRLKQKLNRYFGTDDVVTIRLVEVDAHDVSANVNVAYTCSFNSGCNAIIKAAMLAAKLGFMRFYNEVTDGAEFDDWSHTVLFDPDFEDVVFIKKGKTADAILAKIN